MRAGEQSGRSVEAGPTAGTTAAPRERYAIFLRGVNVGGIAVRMADLRSTLGTLPFEDVATVLASGNVVCSTTLSVADVKLRTEEVLRSRFGYEARVVVVPADDLRVMAASVPSVLPVPPGGGNGAEGDGTGGHTYVTLFSSADALAVFLDEARDLPAQPVLLAGCPAVAWAAPRGHSTDGPLAKLLTRSRFASTTTTRNLTTVGKVLRLLG